MLDVLVRGGIVHDGSGAAPRDGLDVGVRDGRIAAVGSLDDAAAVRTIDASGLIVAPGFIDTPINQDMASRPFLIDPADGARRIADLIERGVRRTTVPVWPWTGIGWLMRAIPDALWTRVGASAHRGRQ